MALPNRKALVRKTRIYVGKEAEFGIMPAMTGDMALYVVSAPTPDQQAQFSDSKYITGHRDQTSRVLVGLDAGNLSVAARARPSGAPGTPPAEDVLMECGLGSKTVTGSTVSYLPAEVKPSCAAIVELDHTTWYVTGCKVDAPKIAMKKTEGVSLEFPIKFRKRAKAGEAEAIAGAAGSTIKLEAGAAGLFDEGALITWPEIAGHATVAAVDYGGDSLTLGSAPTTLPAAGSKVEGWAPAPSFPAGEDLSAAEAQLTLDGAAMIPTSVEVTVNDAIQADQDEMDGTVYPTTLDEGSREVTAAIQARFRREYAARFTDERRQTRMALEIKAGSAAGKRMRITMDRVELEGVQVSESGPRLDISATARSFADAGDDTIKIEYY